MPILKTGLLILILTISGLLISCGKKSEESTFTKPSGGIVSPIERELKEYLDRQQVICENGAICPEYLAKIIIIGGTEKKACTGFLVKEDIIATSSSCLPEFLRNENQSCQNEIFFFFPKSFNHAFERAACDKVLKASSVQGNPAFYRSNVSYLKLASPIKRPTLEISRKGFKDGENYQVWAIDQVGDASGIIKQNNCEAVLNSYIDPLATGSSSPNIIISGCRYQAGNSGAPILSNGVLRGIVSEPVNQVVIKHLESTGLLTAPLKTFYHASNFACAPTLEDSNVDIKECNKRLDEVEAAKLRLKMSLDNSSFEELNIEAQKLIPDNYYIQFQLDIPEVGNVRKAEYVPECFKNANRWINYRNSVYFDLELPNITLKKIINPNGKYSAVMESSIEDSEFLFSPREMKRTGKATITKSTAQSETKYPEILRCSSLF